MASSWKVRLLVVASGIGGLVIAAAQTPVIEAKSNLSGWLTEIGFDQLPYWLTTLAADKWATVGGLALLIVSGSLAFLLRKRRLNRNPQPVAASTHNDIVTPHRNGPGGAKLILLGKSIILVTLIAGGIGLFIGMMLIVFGDYKERLSAQNNEVKKASTDKPAPTPIVEKPIAVAPVETPKVEVTTPPIPEPENKVPEKPPRVFVDKDVTPEFLVGLHEGQTSLGGKTRVSKYLGKWIEVSGSLGEVYGPLLEKAPAVAGLTSPKGTFIIMVFRDEWIGQIAEIAKDKNISVRGEITEIERAKLSLDNCEIIEPSDEDSTRSQQSPPSTATKKRRKSPRG